MTTRRTFLIGTAAGLGAVWLGLEYRGCESDPDLAPLSPVPRADLPATPRPLPELLGRYFGEADPATVERVGRVYLQRFDNDTSRIAEELGEPLRDIEDASELEEAVDRWRQAVDRDFAEMRFVDIDGWQLAATTGRLCGLAHFWLRDA